MPLLDNEELVSSALSIFGINYEDLDIKGKISTEDNTNLDIHGFTQDGLIMSDSTMSIVPASDSSNVKLEMNIPDVSYTNFKDTVFTFKNLDLYILPSSDPQSLEFSALMDSLEIITDKNYVNLKGLKLFFKSFPDEKGIRLDIDINSFLYPDFNDTSFNFEGLDFNMAIGLNGQSLNVSVNLPELNLINKNYKVNLTDLDLGIVLPDLKLSNLDLSIVMPDFHYTNFDDVHIDMDNVNVSLDHIPDSNSFNVNIGMTSLDADGLISLDELFPMMTITGINFKVPASDSELPINLTGVISPLDVTKLDFSEIASLLIAGFNLDTYLSNMSELYNRSYYVDTTAEVSDLDKLTMGLGGIFENFDYSSLDGLVLNLTGLLDSTGIDLAEFGIDVSDYDFSAVKISDLVDMLNNSKFNLSSIKGMLKLLNVDFDDLDMSDLVVSFDKDKFDIAAILKSLNLSESDMSAIMNMLNNSDIDLGSIFKNGDFSCLDGIVLDLTKLLDSIGIDLADFGIEVSDYDLSAIKISELMEILNKFDFDMSTIMAMIKLFGINLDDVDLSGLIAGFDVENFDISGLIKSLNLSKSDISAILDMFTNSDADFAGIFKNFDYSTLDAIVLDLTGFIDSLGIDLADFGIDVSGYDLSAIRISDLMCILNKSKFDMSTIATMVKLFSINLDDLDMSGLIASFDVENFDISTLLKSLNLSESDISAIMGIFSNPDVDFTSMFKNCDYSCLDAIVLDLTGVLDSTGIDLANFGIDVSDYGLSAISMSDLIDAIFKSDFNMADFASKFDLSSFNFDDIDMSGLVASFDAENFDISSLVASLNLSELDVSAIMDMFNNSGVDFATVFKNCDFSCLDAIVLDLTGVLDSAGIDLADFGIDLSDYDLSAIKLSDLIGIINKSDFDMSSLAPMFKLLGLKLDDIDMSGLIASFDVENFDTSSILNSLGLSSSDISDIITMFNNSDIDLGSIFKNCDLSCLNAIVLDLTGLLDSTGIDLADFGIDVSDYDLSAISLSDLIAILDKFNFNMSTVTAMLKLLGLNLDDLDLSGLIASFDPDNFDIIGLLSSVNMFDMDFSSIAGIFNNIDIDFSGIFENFDYSCLDAIVLDLTGLIDSTGINVSDFGIDASDYDFSAISLLDLMGILGKSGFDMTTITAILKLFSIDLDDLDLSGLIVSFDADNFDASTLLDSLNLPIDTSAMLDMFNKNGFDLAEFLNGLLAMFTKKSVEN